MDSVPITTHKLVTTLGAALQARRLRNSSYQFLTNHRQPISLIKQICWYFKYYCPARESGHYRVYLFFDDHGIPAAYGALYLKDVQLYVTECVKPACRGHGYGKVVLSALIEIAQKENRDLIAEIWDDNERSILMHKDAGLELMQTRAHNDGTLKVYILKASTTHAK